MLTYIFKLKYVNFHFIHKMKKTITCIEISYKSVLLFVTKSVQCWDFSLQKHLKHRSSITKDLKKTTKSNIKFQKIQHRVLSIKLSDKISFHNDWSIDHKVFKIPLKNFSLIFKYHHCWWEAVNFRPMLGIFGLWAGIFILPHLL